MGSPRPSGPQASPAMDTTTPSPSGAPTPETPGADPLAALAAHVAEMKRRAMHDPIQWPPQGRHSQSWTAFGLRCCLVRADMGLCGYVHVPATHPDANAEYDDLDVRVHGGLTFRCRDLDGGSWFGFDTLHAGDYLAMPAGVPGLLDHPGRVWTEDDVRAETDRLAEQLAARAALARAEGKDA